MAEVTSRRGTLRGVIRIHCLKAGRLRHWLPVVSTQLHMELHSHA